jgi:hypothetical protein
MNRGLRVLSHIALGVISIISIVGILLWILVVMTFDLARSDYE